MNEQMQQQMMARLDAIAQKLGVAANVLWQATIRQQIVNGWECVLGAAIFGLAVLIGIHWLVKNWKELAEEAFWPALGVLVCVVIFLFFTFNAIDFLANPTYWAFRDILEAVK